MTALNAEVTRQASIIAYANAFTLMLVVSMATAVLLLLLSRQAPGAKSAERVVVD